MVGGTRRAAHWGPSQREIRNRTETASRLLRAGQGDLLDALSRSPGSPGRRSSAPNSVGFNTIVQCRSGALRPRPRTWPARTGQQRPSPPIAIPGTNRVNQRLERHPAMVAPSGARHAHLAAREAGAGEGILHRSDQAQQTAPALRQARDERPPPPFDSSPAQVLHALVEPPHQAARGCSPWSPLSERERHRPAGPPEPRAVRPANRTMERSFAGARAEARATRPTNHRDHERARKVHAVQPRPRTPARAHRRLERRGERPGEARQWPPCACTQIATRRARRCPRAGWLPARPEDARPAFRTVPR
jgi:hypothetical protein